MHLLLQGVGKAFKSHCNAKVLLDYGHQIPVLICVFEEVDQVVALDATQSTNPVEIGERPHFLQDFGKLSRPPSPPCRTGVPRRQQLKVFFCFA